MSDGRFSSKPMRSEYVRDRINDLLAVPGDAKLSDSDVQAFLRSHAVRDEIEALMETPHPAVGELTSAPLHRKTPAAALDLGRPLTSATLVQEYLIGLIFLRVAGWIFLGFGALFLIGALFLFVAAIFGQNNPRDRPPLFASVALVGFAIFIGGAGAWFGIFRGRVITEMCWFCPRGMIWMTEGMFEWYSWSDVPELFCKPHAVRPAIGLRFDRSTSWISFSNTLASRQMVEYIEKRASAECVRKVLHAIAHGSTVNFGAWRLSRSSIGSLSEEFAWTDVIDATWNEREFVFFHRDRREVSVPLDEVAFPSMFAALARGIYAQGRERSH